MKRKLLKIFAIIFMMIPCMFIFASCDKNDDASKNKSVVSSLSVCLADNNAFEYIEDTNTLRFEYGSVNVEKSNFEVTAVYDDLTTMVVSDYLLDTASIKNADVGTYEITFTYAEKTAKLNIEIYPKKILKPSSSGDLTFDFREDTILDIKISNAPDVTFDENTMEYVEGSVASATDVGKYQIKIVPDKNHIWETFDNNNKEEVVFDWEIKKIKMVASEIRSLSFTYQEGVTHTISFDRSREQYFPFDEFFEVTGTISASEKGNYSFVVTLKPEKQANYEIFEIYYDDEYYDYNEDLTAVTYYWEIV